MTIEELQKIECAIAWLTTTKPDPDSLKTRAAIARRELVEVASGYSVLIDTFDTPVRKAA